MKHLKIRHRLAIVFLVMLAGNIFTLAFVIADRDEPIAFIAKQRSGLAYIEPLRQIRQWLPIYRRSAETDANFVTPAAQPLSLLNIERAVNRLDELDRQLGSQLNTTEDFVAVRQDWQKLQESVSDPELLRKTYARLNTRVRALLALVGDQSNLMLDQVLTSYYFIYALVVDLPNGEELLNDFLDFGKGVIEQGRFSADDNNRAVVLSAELQRELDNLGTHYEVALENHPQAASLNTLKQDYEIKVLTLLAYVDRNMIDKKPTGRGVPDEYVQAVEAALDANYKLYDTTAPILDAMLQQRSEALKASERRIVSISVALALAGLLATVWVGRSLVVPIRSAISAFKNPEWTQVSIASSNHDEISELLSAATSRKPVIPAIPPKAADVSAELKRENLELKSLVADLVLEKRSLSSKSIGHHD
jgi:methyl-accepting chemotaxis protein